MMNSTTRHLLREKHRGKGRPPGKYPINDPEIIKLAKWIYQQHRSKLTGIEERIVQKVYYGKFTTTYWGSYIHELSTEVPIRPTSLTNSLADYRKKWDAEATRLRRA